MSAHTAAKSTRLLAEGRVRPDTTSVVPLAHPAFTVRGDSATYRVELKCSCPAYGMCSHLEAALAWQTATPEDRKIMQQILDAYDNAPLTDEQRASGEAAFDRL